jgi:hypothetical protein
MSVPRRPLILVAYDGAFLKAWVGERIFVDEGSAPGPILEFHGAENSCSSLRRAVELLAGKAPVAMGGPFLCLSKRWNVNSAAIFTWSGRPT